MARYAINATITSPATGIAVPSATVTIRETDGTGALATVYQGRAGGDTFDNPLTVANGGIGSDGQLAVYLNDSVAVYYVEVDTGGATRAYEIDSSQPQNAKLTALAGLSGGADRLPYFNGANTMAQSTFTAFGRSLVDDANAGAARTTLGLGTAATATVTTSPTDTTAGRVLKVGDFGVGASASPEVADLDTALRSGFYTLPESADNKPFAQAGTLIVVSRGTEFVAQYASRQAEADLLYVRVKAGAASAFTTWRRVYTQADILGTVSQSSGVPTGAIIQRGSNANGEFVRFADGTQICWRLVDMPRASVNGFFETASFAAAFSTEPVVTLTYGIPVTYDNDNMGPMRTNSISTTVVSITAVRQAGAPSIEAGDILEDVNLIAIGRWY